MPVRDRDLPTETRLDRLGEASARLCFHDEEPAEDRRRDPAVPPRISQKARRGKESRSGEEGLELQGFETPSVEPATRTPNVCGLKSQEDPPTLCRLSRPTPLRQRALQPAGPCR